MAGRVEGGKKAAMTNKANDPDFYRKIGAKGGAKGSADGRIGGSVSRRSKKA
jgi:general stress protein YciG